MYYAIMLFYSFKKVKEFTIRSQPNLSYNSGVITDIDELLGKEGKSAKDLSYSLAFYTLNSNKDPI